MKMTWTNEQKQAIFTRKSNLLVAAAAGSGKTAVLVERIIKMITDPKNPVDVDKLLVVTFTNAAAAEMRERISNAISRELFKSPESKLLKRQLVLLNKAKITTIHSFCLEVIKNYFQLIDIDPKFRVADETEVVLLKSEVMEKLFESKYEAEDTEFLKLVESYSSNRDDSNLVEMIFSMYSFAKSNPFPEKWIKKVTDAFNIRDYSEFKNSIWIKTILSTMNVEISGLKSYALNALNIIEGEESIMPYMESIKDDLDLLKSVEAATHKSFEEFVSCIENIKFKTLKRCKKDADADKKSVVQKLRGKYKDKIKDIGKELNSFTNDDTLLNLNAMYPTMQYLGNTVLEFDKLYSEEKRNKGIIDFNDFEHMALNILIEEDENGEVKPSKTALEIRESYEEVLIDEYQDSNMVQEYILSVVSRKNTSEPNMFMVGDVKQSIYRFRQADPSLFMSKYDSYSKEEGTKDRKILLFKNFRSRKNVIDGVNYIFKSIMSRNIGELDYDENEELKLGASFPEIDEDRFTPLGENELHIIERKSSEDNEDEMEEIDNITLEARMTAKRIKDLLNPSLKPYAVFDKNIDNYRDIKYKDIVILLRATERWAPIFKEQLRKEGIPVFADAGSGYFETIEIKTILSLLQIIDNPIQDIPLLAVLRSPIASFSDEDIIDIKTASDKKYFYDVLKDVISDKKVSEDLLNKCVSFIKTLNEYRELSKYMPIDEFIWYLYTNTGYYGYVGAMPKGKQRQANLKILFQRAKAYESTSFKGLFNFINFINKLKISSKDMGSAKILGENEDVVRIMSIHKSKGLEFPVVILAGCGKNFNLMDMKKSVLFHKELGIGPDFVDVERRISYPTIFKVAIKKKIKIETLSEEMRILYVALTRAKEKLIITGTVSDVAGKCKNWTQSSSSNDAKVQESAVLGSNNYMDWLCLPLSKHVSGAKIREEAGIDIENLNFSDESKWDINIHKKEEFLLEEQAGKDEDAEKITEDNQKVVDDMIREIEENPPITKYYNEIERRLSYEYPYKNFKSFPSSISVTELKRQLNEEEEYSNNIFEYSLKKRPSFMEEKKALTPAEKGTAMHSVMQKLDLKLTTDSESIKKQMDKMIFREIITENQAKAIDINKITTFFNSDLGKRMLNSNSIKREMPFIVRIRASDVYKDADDEYIMLQGAIDCYFEENDEIVLVDYKTDYVSENNIEEISRKYEKQLKYYSMALNKITGKKVKEKYLYLFYNGEIVRFK
ncbi:MAG: helicase-exonuclease AddAB subunit AddA [Clostridium sp.]|nr:helicase-exonuclease AddAB subunit AddA [Clostridium sp.]